ncbi:MAG: metallophosphoesterase [Acidimicrobiia bacterium]|nr:metallophosphoesterase [Acidimicrobiia bacterium]MYC58458.1 metallophosphoesterase [Acidimicrobiia bacterium]MYG94216.1 metallophosphoesterase [Acidimicrobiia bacterium]MYI30436.1 metallophosphoesterase [Acidimicrobiia bacterium]
MRWYTSDHHFGHFNIIGYSNRPFISTAEMDQTMVERWNDVVGDADEVWILGDLVMGKRKRGLGKYVAKLKGRKIFVPGNHDRCWQGHKGFKTKRVDFYEIGLIHEIIDNPEAHTVAGRRVLLSHFPYRQGLTYQEKFAEWRPIDTGDWLLHGHVHASWQQQGQQINVGVDAWNFAPVSEDSIAAMIQAGAAEVPCLKHVLAHKT